METLASRILVVEDFELFQALICSTLEKRPELQIVAEVADGLEAVQKAEELQPDLIILDIGLPSLNGIDAARRIRKLAPKSKILFMSQESSPEVVREALALGALGYVQKVHAKRELLAAVDAVLEGRQFVGSELSGRAFTPASDASTPDRPSQPLPPPASEKMKAAHSHEVAFYADDAAFVAGFTRFIESALLEGYAVIAVATESHRPSLLQTLQEHGVDVVALAEQGRFVFIDVADMLAAFMMNDQPDPARFQAIVGSLVAAVAKGSKGDRPHVAACGECAPALWKQGNLDAAIVVERLCTEIARSCDIDILCGYILSSFQREQERRACEKICAEHSAFSSQ